MTDPTPTPPEQPVPQMPIPPHLFFTPIGVAFNLMIGEDGGKVIVMSVAGAEGVAFNVGWRTEVAGQIGETLVNAAQAHPNTGLVVAGPDDVPRQF